ncbi:hypothetical protein ACO0LG_22760 [Undibacterium sp. Ji42W]|uniref:hypothetical protein n=1 Tax=Undibacterium sp. Ji42W TaxID=3413039 RepID=UPI003BF36E6A
MRTSSSIALILSSLFMLGCSTNGSRQESFEELVERNCAIRMEQELKKQEQYKSQRAGTIAIRRFSKDYAEIDVKTMRNGHLDLMTYSVELGSATDMQGEVINKIISIIAARYEDQFNWESSRLKRIVRLSTAQQEREALHSFLMKEFFSDDQKPSTK